jgi:UDP-glucuronate 4-epimerase
MGPTRYGTNLFTKAILTGEPIQVFNNGEMQRDFTYIDDIVEGIIRVTDKPACPNLDWDATSPDPGTSSAPYRLYNVGNNNPVSLMDFIGAIETALGTTAKKEFLPMQPGDVTATCADIDALVDAIDYHPQMAVQDGINNFIAWYLEYMHKEKQ